MQEFPKEIHWSDSFYWLNGNYGPKCLGLTFIHLWIRDTRLWFSVILITIVGAFFFFFNFRLREYYVCKRNKTVNFVTQIGKHFALNRIFLKPSFVWFNESRSKNLLVELLIFWHFKFGNDLLLGTKSRHEIFREKKRSGENNQRFFVATLTKKKKKKICNVEVICGWKWRRYFTKKRWIAVTRE